jgi:hypothetical protein
MQLEVHKFYVFPKFLSRNARLEIEKLCHFEFLVRNYNIRYTSIH